MTILRSPPETPIDLGGIIRQQNTSGTVRVESESERDHRLAEEAKESAHRLAQQAKDNDHKRTIEIGALIVVVLACVWMGYCYSTDGDSERKKIFAQAVTGIIAAILGFIAGKKTT